jgi:hypothetical protein
MAVGVGDHHAVGGRGHFGMAVALANSDPLQAVSLLEALQANENQFSEEFDSITFGEWTSLKVYIPQPDINSAITPPFMEAFLVLQRQLFQLAALASAGVADAGQLTDADKRELQLKVIVSGGSSNLETRLKEPLEAVLKKMVGKLTGKQSVIVIVSIAI